MNAPYHLSYEGKAEREAILGEPGPPPLEIDCGLSTGRLFQGDNLAVLRWMLHTGGFRSACRMAYLDPPYATAKAFVDRGVQHAYDDVLLGAQYIESLRRRLIVIRELLADDGAIFLHLDQTMVFEMKVVMDEVFGRANFRNCITRKKCNPKNYTRLTFGKVADHVLFYSKSDKYVWHRPYEAWTERRMAEEYPYVDEATGRRYKRVPVHAPGVRNGATGRAWRGVLPPPGKHWQYRPAKLDEMDARGEIYWSANGNPRRKVFLDQSNGIPVQDIWMEFKDPHNQNIRITGYPTEKNADLLARLVAAVTDANDLVLDAYCGSGTTLEAAAALGRRFVGIDSSGAAIAATANRMRNGRTPMGDFVTERRKREKGAERPGLFDKA